jgi:hypothetical protein
MTSLKCPITRRRHCSFPECTDYPAKGNRWCAWHIKEVEAEFGTGKIADQLGPHCPECEKPNQFGEVCEGCREEVKP